MLKTLNEGNHIKILAPIHIMTKLKMMKSKIQLITLKFNPEKQAGTINFLNEDGCNASTCIAE